MWSVCGIYIKGRCHRGDSSCCWQQAPFVVIFRAGNIALRYFLLTFIFSREDDVGLPFFLNTIRCIINLHSISNKVNTPGIKNRMYLNADSYLDAQTSKGVKEGVGVGRVGKLQH